MALSKPKAAAGSGITEGQHETLDTLVHGLAEDAFTENTFTGSKLTSSIAWTDDGKTLKIRESRFTFTGSKLTGSVTEQFNGLGAIIATLTRTFTYSGSKLIEMDTVKS